MPTSSFDKEIVLSVEACEVLAKALEEKPKSKVTQPEIAIIKMGDPALLRRKIDFKMLPRSIIIRTEEEAAAVRDAIRRSKENGRAAAFMKQALSKAPIVKGLRARSSEDEQVAFNHLAEGSNPSGPTTQCTSVTCENCTFGIKISRESRQCFIDKRVQALDTQCPIGDKVRTLLESELKKFSS